MHQRILSWIKKHPAVSIVGAIAVLLSGDSVISFLFDPRNGMQDSIPTIIILIAPVPALLVCVGVARMMQSRVLGGTSLWENSRNRRAIHILLLFLIIFSLAVVLSWMLGNLQIDIG